MINRLVRPFRHHKLILVFLTATIFFAIFHIIEPQTVQPRPATTNRPPPTGGHHQQAALPHIAHEPLYNSGHHQPPPLPLRSIKEATAEVEIPSGQSIKSNPKLGQTKSNPKSGQSKPYRLGPKIKDWDQRRREWLKKNPTRSNFIGPGKPRVLLATGSAPGRCENPSGDHFLLKSMKNKVDYCRLHGCEVYYNMAVIKAEMPSYWGKLPLLRKLMVAHPAVEFIWWMDSDALFTDMAFDIPWDKYEDYNLVLPGWSDKVYEEKNWIGLNAGIFFIRNCQWSLDLLDAWASMGQSKKVRVKAGKLLTRELKGRPDFEADDQSALVYLLSSQRHKWGPRIFFETTYCLHGYWDFLVDRYEDMIEKYRPGYGDDRWPLVTHFVGCKPCAKSGHYPADRCAKQMDRAFDFADNQVLNLYGLSHESLGSMRVKKITPTHNIFS